MRDLLKRRGTAAVVVGGAHDLTDNVKRLTKNCRLVVVTPRGYPE